MIPAYLPPLANHLWQSTVFAGAAGLLTLAFRKNRAAVRYGLWLAASVKFLIPFVVLVSLGGQFGWRTAPMQSSVPLVMEQIGQPFTGPVTPPLLAAVPEAPSRVPGVLFAIWLVGFAVSAIVWGRKWWRVRRVVRSGTAMDWGLAIRVICSPTKLEPGVFGIFRPVLLLPEGIAERLTPGQLQAIVAHELCHVRRRDNLAAALHMVVEAVFWFYPLVWWIGTRMVAERERACDEAVLAEMGDARAYASGILNVCKFYLESPLVCVAGVTGANLKRRIEAIMTGGPARHVGFAKKLLLASAAIAVAAGPVVVGVLEAPLIRAQSAARMAFEVASVRQTPTARLYHLQFDQCKGGGRFVTAGTPLLWIVSFGYHMRDAQVSGAPSWLSAFDSGYDIEAKPEGPVSLDQCRLMVQSLLADRFKLSVHREIREGPLYALVIGRSGSKLHEVHKDGAGGGVKIDGAVQQALSETEAPSGWSMSRLAEYLSSFAGRPVEDKTGLQGTYSFTFDFARAAGDDRPDVFTALQEQLGLKLESIKGPVDILVIDHVERPSEN